MVFGVKSFERKGSKDQPGMSTKFEIFFLVIITFTFFQGKKVKQKVVDLMGSFSKRIKGTNPRIQLNVP